MQIADVSKQEKYIFVLNVCVYPCLIKHFHGISKTLFDFYKFLLKSN